MLTKQIRSLQHKLVKQTVRLRCCSDMQKQHNAIFVPSKKMIIELSQHFVVKTFFYTEKPLPIQAAEYYQVTDAIMKKITGLPCSDGYAAIFSKPSPGLKKTAPLLILDGLQDPGNVGTLFRTALGLQWSGVILLPNTANPWQQKALRASKGAVFHLPYQEMQETQLADFLQKEQLHTYIANVKGPSLAETTVKQPVALILSAEGKGANLASYPFAKSIALPMEKRTESYNVAVAGGILLYSLRNCG